MGGQGRVLAGAVCGSAAFINDVLLPFQRNTGPTLSPFNAWVVLTGLETLDLRARRQSDNALAVGKAIEGRIERLLHPGFPSHPPHEMALCPMEACWTFFGFELPGGHTTGIALPNRLPTPPTKHNTNI